MDTNDKYGVCASDRSADLGNCEESLGLLDPRVPSTFEEGALFRRSFTETGWKTVRSAEGKEDVYPGKKKLMTFQVKVCGAEGKVGA
ncbi:hypothetical protein KM043_012481 [Ampulex compressa]|nr:hypothetical protein KM043_012481 [Ampulex compressa]